jgi:membrane-associated phospholipid phosphatase
MSALSRVLTALRHPFEDLRDDLVSALSSGAACTPLRPPGGDSWLVRWAWVCLIVGVTLVGGCGYHAGFLRINGVATEWPDWLWQLFTSLGDERVPFALALLLARARPRIFWALVLSALVGTAYSHGLKPLFAMPRPPAVLDPGVFHLIGPGHRRGSFPSGHSVTAGVFFGVLIYYARGWEPRALLTLIAVLVGISRVAVGVHWPVDVAFGLFGGVLAAWAGTRLAARWPGPATDAALHLPLVALCAIFAAALTLWDGGYPAARWPLAILGYGTLAFAAVVYLARPLRAVLVSPGGRRRGVDS